MPPASRITDMHVCPMVTGIVPHVGGPILPPGVPQVLIGFLPAATVTNMCTCVGPPDIIVKGSAGVFINYLPAARMGDTTAHGGTIILGEPTVMIGETGSGGAGGGGAGAVAAGTAASGANAPDPADNTSENASEYSQRNKPDGGSSSGGGGSSTPSSGGGNASPLPTSIPADCASAPKTVQIPANVNARFNALMKNSFPGGTSQEQGAILVEDAKGNVSVANETTGAGGNINLNDTPPPGTKVVGDFHTHPYDNSEGNWKNVSFSGQDMGDNANLARPGYVQSGDGQFLVLPTAKTPKGIDTNKLNDSQNARVQELVDQGKPFDEASRIAANETAKKYGMAYYEGKNGTLTKVSC